MPNFSKLGIFYIQKCEANSNRNQSEMRSSGGN